MAAGSGQGSPVASVAGVSSPSSGPRVLHAEQIALEQFRMAFGFHPWHFWQLADVHGPGYRAVVPVESGCDSVTREYQHTSGLMNGRVDMRGAVNEARELLMNKLGFPVTRTWVTETVPIMGRRGSCAEFVTSLGYVRRVGRMVVETLSAGMTVTYSDGDGDGLKETFTVTTPVLASSIANDELVVRTLPGDASDSRQVEIAPITITRNVNGTATITGRAWLCVKPERYDGEYRIPTEGGAQSNDSLDPRTDTNFVAQLELIRRYTDVSTGAVVTKDTCLNGCNCNPSGVCCAGGKLADGTYAVAVRDSRLGICSIDGCADGDFVTLTYEAGFDDLTRGIDWMRVVARLAATFMNGACAACKTAPGQNEFARWQTDRAYYGNFQGFKESTGTDNPFNTREGAIWAWERVKSLKITKGRR
jgi:hypothetical protein